MSSPLIFFVIFFVVAICGVPALCCYVYQFVENYLIVPHDVRQFENRVTKLLTKDGYKWERDEGDLYIYKNDIRFRAQCYRMPERPAIRVLFDYAILDEELKRVSSLGQVVLTASLSSEYIDIPTRVQDNVIHSFYRADIRNAREFIQEFNSAYERFGAMMQTMANFRPRVQQGFPASAKDETQTRKIGFN